MFLRLDQPMKYYILFVEISSLYVSIGDVDGCIVEMVHVVMPYQPPSYDVLL